MGQKQKKERVKKIVILLVVLLVMDLTALAAVKIIRRKAEDQTVTVAVSENLIAPEKKGTKVNTQSSAERQDQVRTAETVSAEGRKNENMIYLWKKRTEENHTFHVENMFPGDRKSEYFRVKVSYQDRVTVRFHAEVGHDSRNLGEALKIKVVIYPEEEVLYDGVIQNMPEAVNHEMASRTQTTDELSYEITAYLDTSAGNEYQNQRIEANFHWWIEEDGNLTGRPVKDVLTGDTANILFWAAGVIASGILCIALVAGRKRREEKENG